MVFTCEAASGARVFYSAAELPLVSVPLPTKRFGGDRHVSRKGAVVEFFRQNSLDVRQVHSEQDGLRKYSAREISRTYTTVLFGHFSCCRKPVVVKTS